MTEEEILKIFEETGALLSGHFELRSKLHSDRYFQCANVLRYPRIAAKLCDEVVAKMNAACDIGKIDGVISPAVGGILVGHEVARALDTKCVFAEKVQAEGLDATGKPITKLAMRRFTLKPGERYVVAEDVVTKGGRVQETIDLVQAAGAEVAAVVLLVDRSKGSVKFGNIPMFSLVQIQPTTWEPAACPLCAAGGHPVHPGS
ncbi:MAG: orotate phosphoribosyltransferase [Kiritimatiellae bacterium]|nr:orotate phosphoribosyltransferase [Kiritimatiellia bacterium]